MLTPTSSRPGPGRSRGRRWLLGAVTLLAAFAAMVGLAGLQAPAASAGVARAAAADHALAAHVAAALAHSQTGSAPARTVQPQRAGSGSVRARSGKVTAGHSAKNDVSPKLRNIKPKPFTKRPRKTVPVLPLVHPHATRAGPVAQGKADSVLQSKANPVLQNKLAAANMPGAGLNFDGISYPGVSCFCAPPDPNGAAGATQYVQIGNEGVPAFAPTTGSSVRRPASIESLWSGFGGPCETPGAGDPVVAYAPPPNPRVISQLAVAAPTFIHTDD